MRNIEVSEEIYQELLKRVESFEDKPSDVIWRLLSLPSSAKLVTQSTEPSSDGHPLVTQGGSIPHGTKLSCKYKGRTFSAEVQNARIVVDNKQFSSPSGAAHHVARTMGNPTPSIDGWKFWKYYDGRTKTWKTLRVLQH